MCGRCVADAQASTAEDAFKAGYYQGVTDALNGSADEQIMDAQWHIYRMERDGDEPIPY